MICKPGEMRSGGTGNHGFMDSFLGKNILWHPLTLCRCKFGAQEGWGEGAGGCFETYDFLKIFEYKTIYLKYSFSLDGAKELIFWNKIKYLNQNIFRTRCWKPLIFQTQITWSNRNHSLKYLRYATFGSKDIVIRKSEFAAKTQFLWEHHNDLFMDWGEGIQILFWDRQKKLLKSLKK